MIHCEESDAAFQHFYPLSLLKKYTKTLMDERSIPIISNHVTPARTLTKKFIFPVLLDTDSDLSDDLNHTASNGIPIHNGPISFNGTTSTQPTPNSNPFPHPPWYPESAHFVRQWWPSLTNVPRVSCTVVLLATHDPVTHRTRFVLAQHYFRVPLNHAEWIQGPSGVIPNETATQLVNGAKSRDTHLTPVITSKQAEQDDALMHLWYVSTPFEVVRIVDGEEEDEQGAVERPRPLVAVDFGHAVWIEYVDSDDDRIRVDGEQDREPKWLRFVTFPPFIEDVGMCDVDRPGAMEGEVRTLEVPDEIDLNVVETINIDQSQGAVILSDSKGKIFILCYE